MSSGEAVPAGWYPDPSNPLQERLWDGDDWVDRVRPRPPVAAAPATESTSQQEVLPPTPPPSRRSALAIGSILAASISVFITTGPLRVIMRPDNCYLDTLKDLYWCGDIVNVFGLKKVGLVFLLALLSSVVAIVLGHGALYLTRQDNRLRGKRLARTGTVVGWATLVLYLLIVSSK
jgi:hypothetical protein